MKTYELTKIEQIRKRPMQSLARIEAESLSKAVKEFQALYPKLGLNGKGYAQQKMTTFVVAEYYKAF